MWHYKKGLLAQQPTRPFKKLKRSQQVLFFQELGELLAAGYSIVRSLDILEKSHTKWQGMLLYVAENLADGQNLVTALAPFISTTIELQLSLAQEHGDLAQTLVVLGQNLSRINQQESKLKQVMRYPMILLGLLGLMLIALRCFLYPIINQWQVQGQRPGDGHSEIFWWSGLTFGLFIALIVWLWWQRQAALKRVAMLAKLPIFGSLVKSILTYQVSQQLAMLLASGLTVPEIIEQMVMKAKQSNLVVDLARLAQHDLARGMGLEEFIWQHDYFNQSLAGYFSRGHTSQDLADYLTYYAKLQFEDVVRRSDRMIGALQPLFFGIVGLAIVGLYISMLLPMYQNIGGMS